METSVLGDTIKLGHLMGAKEFVTGGQFCTKIHQLVVSPNSKIGKLAFYHFSNKNSIVFGQVKCTLGD